MHVYDSDGLLMFKRGKSRVFRRRRKYRAALDQREAGRSAGHRGVGGARRHWAQVARGQGQGGAHASEHTPGRGRVPLDGTRGRAEPRGRRLRGELCVSSRYPPPSRCAVARGESWISLRATTSRRPSHLEPRREAPLKSYGRHRAPVAAPRSARPQTSALRPLEDERGRPRGADRGTAALRPSRPVDTS